MPLSHHPLGEVKAWFLGYLTKQDEKRELIPYLGMQLAQQALSRVRFVFNLKKKKDS
jgi:hypothetical protein